MTWENYAIDIGSCYYLTKHYWQLKLLKFLDATFKKQCNVVPRPSLTFMVNIDFLMDANLI